MLEDLIELVGNSIRLAQADGLNAGVGNVFERLGLLGAARRFGELPDEAEFEARVRLQSLSQVLMLECAEEISTSFREEGVRHFFTKGIALLGRPYNTGDRSVSDIDLFVRHREIDAAVDVLEQLGYSIALDHEQSGPHGMRTTLAFVKSAGSDLEAVNVDLHWALDPVDRVLPHFGDPLPAGFWKNIVGDGIPRPAPMDHVAILFHHLVHTDLMHFRSLIDAALLLDGATDDAIGALWETCGELGIQRFARGALDMLEVDLGVRLPDKLPKFDGLWPAPVPVLEDWIRLIWDSPDADFEAITRRRLWRRTLTADSTLAPLSLLKDVVLPPRDFLRWRWPEARSPWEAWKNHAGQLARKVRGG